MKKVIVMIPYGKDQYELAKKAAKLHEIRAGIDCEVHIVEDEKRVMWVKMHNDFVKKLNDYDYYCYSCADYIPGSDYLKIAIESLEGTGKGLFCFNDGKWHGMIATVGVITKEYLKRNYEGNLFNPVYHTHYADTELSQKAIEQGELVYDPEAVLMEADYEKEQKRVNIKDQMKFRELNTTEKYG